jgi:light-regulated signal transduction histidine kinase (bacteriophytochrome)
MAASSTGEALEFLNYFGTSATRMEALRRDLLLYTKMGTVAESAESTDANAVLAGVLEILSSSVAECDARITSDGLPSNTPIHGAHLQQLLQNLIGNAIKYCSPQRTPVIHIGAEIKDGEWMFFRH